MGIVWCMNLFITLLYQTYDVSNGRRYFKVLKQTEVFQAEKQTTWVKSLQIQKC